jgi:hypothetical protein
LIFDNFLFGCAIGMMVAFLDRLGLGHHFIALDNYGIESLADVDIAVRMPLRDCADVLRATGMTPHEWTAICRAYYMLQDWCQRSHAEDAIREAILAILVLQQ